MERGRWAKRKVTCGYRHLYSDLVRIIFYLARYMTLSQLHRLSKLLQPAVEQWWRLSVQDSKVSLPREFHPCALYKRCSPYRQSWSRLCLAPATFLSLSSRLTQQAYTFFEKKLKSVLLQKQRQPLCIGFLFSFAQGT